jgi:glucuronate isomerase
MEIDFNRLYSWARDLPIVDWHNHLDMRMLAEDRPLGSLYDVWVKADPYKHRAMRICGEAEFAVTGGADEAEKWAAWMRTLPKLVGNPLFAWAKMEMEWLGLDAGRYLRGAGENIALSDWTPSKMLARFKVEHLSPCVGADSGELRIENGELGIDGRGGACPRIVPSLRMNVGDEIGGDVLARFCDSGCRVVDVSVDDAADLGRHLDSMLPVASFAAAHGWTMLLHLGALRETSARLRRAAGPAGGFAGMRSPVDPAAVAEFLDGLERRGSLPRTVLMSLNPEAHAQLAVLAGSFVEGGVAGKVQLGPAWWWCDHAEGIRDVLEKNAAYGVLSAFIGMTTDSRSLLSFVRHDYFRRILCRWLADKIAAGDFPDDPALMRPLVENVCHRNAKSIFV